MTDMSERPTSVPETCPTGFPEELLSGYLDDALTQGEEQRVRLHLEDCAVCRRLHHDLRTLREATMSTKFVQPSDDQWSEAPRGGESRLLRGGGWLLIVVWLAAVGGFALWQLATAPGDAWVKILVFSGLSGVVMLFLSILIDRLRTLPGDRYRRVQK